MKQLTKLTISAAIFAALAGCSSNPTTSQSEEGSTQAVNQQTGSTEIQSMDADAADSSQTADLAEPNSDSQGNKVQSSIDLNQKNNQLVAKVTTHWNGAQEGELYLKWNAPADTTCHSTKLPITKFNDSNDLSIAKRPITSLYTDKLCPGKWQVDVVDQSGNIVASESYTVEDSQ